MSARKLAKAAALIVVTLVSVELATRVVAYLAWGLDREETSKERRAFLATLPETRSAPGADELGSVRVVEAAWGTRYELHPYFGYTLARGIAPTNNHGFPAGGLDYPYRGDQHEFVIGVFGGSVAAQLVGQPAGLLDRLRPALQARGFDSITVLPFALGGWHQPQTFHALVHYLDTLDLAVFVDGFNEVIHVSSHAIQDYPSWFPLVDIYTGLASRESGLDISAEIAELGFVHTLATKVTRQVEESALGSSILVHLVW